MPTHWSTCNSSVVILMVNATLFYIRSVSALLDAESNAPGDFASYLPRCVATQATRGF
jgi:hypothetical protein